MQQDDFMVRFLSIFEEVADTLVHSVDTIAVAADLDITPDPLVRFLGGWIGAPADPEHGLHHFRERDWVRAQTRALSARGTRAGLADLLGVLAGPHPVEIADGGGVFRQGTCPEDDTGWVRVRMPLPGGADPQHVLELIRAEVPIGVEVELDVVPVAAHGPDGSLIPRPRDPQDESDPLGRQAHWQAVPGGPYYGDGGPGDVYPPIRDVAGRPAPAAGDEPLSGAVRRLPGTAGRAVRAGRICPTCAEPNQYVSLVCLRCGSATQVPRPAVVPEPEPETVPLWPENEDWPAEHRIWPGVVLVVSLLLLLSGVLTGLFLLG
jgi:phage tail-like protein